MRVRETLLLAGLLLLHAAAPSSADDVVVDLGTGDDMVVQGGEIEGERLKMNNVTGPPRTAAALLMGNGSPETHPLCLYRDDSGDPTRNGTWLWKGGGGAVTNLSLKVDGNVSFDADPTDQTCSFNANGDTIYADPDKVSGGLPSMVQIGADTEQALLLRGDMFACTGCSPARPTPKLILGMDFAEDWVWKLEADGTQCWGDGGPTTGDTQDGDQGIDSFDVCLDRVENGADEFVRFTLDIDGDGAGTREIDLVRPVVQGTGVPTHGGTLWGSTADAAFDSGDEVCGSVPGTGLTCHATLDPKDGSEHACAGTMPETSASGLFYALCF